MAAESSPFQTWLAERGPLVEKVANLLRSKRFWAIALISSGAWGTIFMAYKAKRLSEVRTLRNASGAVSRDAGEKAQKVAVDAVFFKRLAKIIKIIIPGPLSSEALCMVALTILLVARTYISVIIADILGQNAQFLVSKRWNEVGKGVLKFAIVTLPASAVNSGLKYFKEILVIRFRVRLTEHVHDQYLRGVNFYKACNLGSERIDNADQRVTSDIKKFAGAFADIYTSLFKPLLDMILFTFKLTENTGWTGPLIMYSYFVLSGFIKRVIMPSFGKLVAHESTLEGEFRTAHQRLITNSEEIAFYDGSFREKTIINSALQAIYRHVCYVRYLRSLVLIFDGLLVKYWASIAGYSVLAAPMIFNVKGSALKGAEELTKDYIRNSQYLSQLSQAVGQLVLIGNNLTTIAGYTSRVSELLEMVKSLSEAGNKPFTIVADAPAPPPVSADEKEKEPAGAFRETIPGLADWLQKWSARCDAAHDARMRYRHASKTPPLIGGGKLEEGGLIKFEHVDIVSPEGKLLVRDLNVEVGIGQNVMVTGPNGAGKSSLFRVIGELWPLHNGRLIKPRKEDILFVPQKPYLVLGTLRDQIIYPHSQADMRALGITDDDLDHLLAVVDPARTITTQWRWDEVKDWFVAFSGGQKQRVAMARLFYHKPKYAILDECTSAVSDEVEDKLYETCKVIGITLFTVSHRRALARHHDYILSFDGRGSWEFKPVNHAELAAQLAAPTPSTAV